MEGVANIAEKVLPYLRSCKKEVDKPINGQVKGVIPSWLKGSLLRNGSGLLEIGPDKLKHVFDGMALIHRFSLHDGQVTYQNKFLRSDAFKVNMEANRLILTEFATKRSPDLCKTIFQKYASTFSPDDFTDNDLVNIVQYSDEFYAHSETNNIWRIDPDTLETIKKVNLRNYLSLSTASAHPQEDVDGTVYNIGMVMKPSTRYIIAKFPKKERADEDLFKRGSIVSSIPAGANYGNQSYFHSFGITKNYFIFVEQPLEAQYSKLAFGDASNQTAGDTMVWHSEEKNIFHIISRSTGEELKTKYVSDKAFFVFHHINAYEEDGHLVVDLCRHDGNIVKDLYVDVLKSMLLSKKETDPNPIRGVSCTARYVIPLNVSGKSKPINENLITLKNCSAKAVLQKDGVVVLQHEDLAQNGPWLSELPRINYAYNGEKYRYSYAVARKPDPKYSALIKVDCETKTALPWREEGTMPSEPVFVPNPDSKTEDDGVLLASLLFMSDEHKVSLIVLDARTMTELGRADFVAESSVPANFHGIFVAKS